MRFANRREAGRLLAAELVRRGITPGIVLGLARGGVPVAYEISERLGVPLDVLVVRKLGVPGHEELAMGAIAGDTRVLNDDVISQLGISPDMIGRAVEREREQMERRTLAYRGTVEEPTVAGLDVALVDDGLATGASMRAAAGWSESAGAASARVVVPVAAPATVADFARSGIEVVCVHTPAEFIAVGLWYVDFRATSDGEVRSLLGAAGER